MKCAWSVWAWDRFVVSSGQWVVNGLRSLCIIVSGAVCQGPDWGLKPLGPPGILIRELAAYSRRSRASQSHTHSLFNTHTLVILLSLTNTFAFTRKAFLNLSHLCRRGLFDSRLRIRFCVLLYSYSDWLMLLRGFLNYSEVVLLHTMKGDFFLMTSYPLSSPIWKILTFFSLLIEDSGIIFQISASIFYKCSQHFAKQSCLNQHGIGFHLM